MGQKTEPDRIRVYEPSPVNEVFVTGILPIEKCGEYVRITHVSERPDFEAGGEMVRNIVSRIVYPARAFDAAVKSIVGRLRCPHCGSKAMHGMMIADGDHSGPLSS